MAKPITLHISGIAISDTLVADHLQILSHTFMLNPRLRGLTSFTSASWEEWKIPPATLDLAYMDDETDSPELIVLDHTDRPTIFTAMVCQYNYKAPIMIVDRNTSPKEWSLRIIHPRLFRVPEDHRSATVSLDDYNAPRIDTPFTGVQLAYKPRT